MYYILASNRDYRDYFCECKDREDVMVSASELKYDGYSPIQIIEGEKIELDPEIYAHFIQAREIEAQRKQEQAAVEELERKKKLLAQLKQELEGEQS